ncbi:MAG: hypothetical protein CSB15_00305 [Clostridiales bacterium]|nr:MAG: hypothetical protein CSB15_00305 [Clostridiales bacterium]
MKTKLIIVGLLLSLSLSIVGIYYNNKNDTIMNNSPKIEKNFDKAVEVKNKVKKTIENDIKNEDLKIVTNSDHITVDSNFVDLVAVCKLNSIDGSTNKNPITKKYTMIQSYGKLDVVSFIKGKFDKKQIDFIMGGGKIKLSDYYEGLTKEEKERFDFRNKHFNKLTKKEMENRFVQSYSIDTVNNLDKSKYYLCYLKYKKDYNRYSLIGYKENLREVKFPIKQVHGFKFGTKSNDYIFIKNENTGKFEKFHSLKEIDASLSM